MKLTSSHLAFTAAAVLAASSFSAGAEGTNLRSDTAYEANFVGPDSDPVTKNQNSSNWPGLPERQAGKSYSKIVTTTSGFRPRNAESGRR